MSSVSETEKLRLSELNLSLEWTSEDTIRFLVLRDLDEPRQLPLAVDFLNSALVHRLKHGIGKNQLLPKALGIKSHEKPFVFDATAGLGVDSFIIAAYGCRVRSIERIESIYALLEDGLSRLRSSLETVPSGVDYQGILSRLSFEQGDAAKVMNQMSEEEMPDVIYLDPMYPEEGRSKSALPKKGMQIFRKLVGRDDDSEVLFTAAMQKARQRVVVKRPLHAPAIKKNPTHVFEGKTARYDMYLTK